MGASGSGGLISAVGSIMSGNAQAAAYQYQAGVAQINKQIADQNADYARYAGEVEAQQGGMKTRALLGTTVAQQGAGGLAIGSGSQGRVTDSIREVGAEDVGIIRSNAAKRAYGYEVEAAGQQAQIGLDQMAASQAKTAGYINAFSSILGAGGSVASKWSQAGSAGIFGGSDSGLSGMKGIVS